MNKNLRRGAASLLFAGLVVSGLSACSTQAYDGPHTGCHVTSKDRTKDSDGDSDARVYTSNCGTFKVGDDIFHGEYNSADVFGSIQVGHTYDFVAYGYRNGFTSDFPNIEKATEVKS